MADRVVYLVTKLTRDLKSADLAFVDDAMLGEALAQGWETSTTLPDRVVMVGSRKVKATMIVLKLAGENRGMVLHREERDDHGRNVVTMDDDFGSRRSMTPMQGMINMLDKVSRALVNTGGAGHLGSARDHSMPGMTIISGETVSKAFDVGINAYIAGQTVDTCPFPAGSVAQQRWLQGYRTAEREGGKETDSMALNGARAAGATAVKSYGPDDVVECPYPKGSPLRQSWIDGFREAGGRVE